MALEFRILEYHLLNKVNAIPFGSTGSNPVGVVLFCNFFVAGYVVRHGEIGLSAKKLNENKGSVWK